MSLLNFLYLRGSIVLLGIVEVQCSFSWVITEPSTCLANLFLIFVHDANSGNKC